MHITGAVIRGLKLARRRWKRRGAYASRMDVVKAMYLQFVNEWRGSRGGGGGLWIRAAGLKEPAWLRRGGSDFLVFQEIFENGEYRPISRWDLPANATVVDLGGNVGLSSAYFLSVMPDAHVLVVEPDAANCRSIERTCGAMIASGKLRVKEAFAAARDGAAGIDRKSRSWAFKMVVGSNAGSERIACVTVPTLMGECGFGEIDLLKCDIEGTEAELFADCEDWIGKVRHLVVETHAPYRIANLFRDLDQAGWRFETLMLQEDEKVGLAFLRAVGDGKKDARNKKLRELAVTG